MTGFPSPAPEGLDPLTYNSCYLSAAVASEFAGTSRYYMVLLPHNDDTWNLLLQLSQTISQM